MHTLGLMCGAGVLPARMASEARRQGWRIVAFAFPGSDDLGDAADTRVPSRIDAMGPVIEALVREKVTAMAFSGKFWMGDLLTARGDAAQSDMVARAGTLLDGNITQAIVTTLDGLGIELLDQRRFLGDWLVAGARTWSSRPPGEQEWTDIRRGFAVARLLADAGVGQTVVVKRGVVSAAEAIEGTTEAIRRGTALSGVGAVVVKAVAHTHDFRFDIPGVGPETLDAAIAGGATAVAMEAGRVLVVDREATIRRADAAGLALVSVDAGS